MVGGAARGRSEPGGTRFDSPLAQIVVLPQKTRNKRGLGGQFGITLGSFGDDCGMMLGSFWCGFEIILGSFGDCCGTVLG